MDPVAAPLCTGLVLAASALSGLGGNEYQDLRGLIGNLAAGTLDTALRRVVARLADGSIDPSTGLPRNHDIQRASADALRGAALALLLEVAGRSGERKPWIPLIRDFIRAGRLKHEPLIKAFQRPDLEWLSTLEKAVRSDDFDRWHASAQLNDSEIASCFDKDRCTVKHLLLPRFSAWVLKTVGDHQKPEAFDTALTEGWRSQPQAPLIRFEDVYCLFFREFLKQRPEVFRIYVTNELADLRAMMRSIDAALLATPTYCSRGSAPLSMRFGKGNANSPDLIPS